MTVHAPIRPSLVDLIQKYDGRAPRYTSYPTAVQFTPQVDAATYRTWLSELPLDRAVSVYLHIPFCQRLCWYCGCNTRAVNRHEPIADYVQLLVKEMDLLDAALPGRLPAQAIHLGGGSPNMLTPADMDVLFGRLKTLFDQTDDISVSAELDPANLTRDWVEAAASHGLNRASLGVQNLSPRVQEAVNRRESFEEIVRTVTWLREFGVSSINLDLMYGLPRQTVANTLATLDKVLTLRPERLALFGYAHVPWMKAHQQLIDTAELPGPAERLDQSFAAAERLVEEGYVQIGLDHFALPEDDLAVALTEGRLRRNFQGYTTDPAETLLGLGASAIGYMTRGFVQNIAQELPWRNAVAAGDLPVARGVAFTPDDRFRGEIIERLMCDFAVDLEAISRRHGRDVADLTPELARLGPFLKDQLATVTGSTIQVTELGRPVVRAVCALFDQHLDPDAQRHSRTI